MKYPQYIDIHSHLNDPRFDADILDTLSRMREAEILSIVVGTDKKMSERAIALAEKHTDIWATIGLHPTDNTHEVFDHAIYRMMAEYPRVVGIGECGLDYFRLESERAKGNIANMDAEVDRQQQLFVEHMELAASVNKPLMIHGRPEVGSMDAYEDILFILKNGIKAHGDKVRGNVHFFVGNVDIAKQFLDIGFTMSFTGVVTFSHDYDEVLKYIPLESIMAETDAPYVAPKSMRGKRNEPSFIPETVRAIASIRGVDEEKVREALVANATRVFTL